MLANDEFGANPFDSFIYLFIYLIVFVLLSNLFVLLTITKEKRMGKGQGNSKYWNT